MSKISLTAKIEPELRDGLQELSRKSGLTVSSLVCDAIAQYLGEESPIENRLAALEAKVELLTGKG